MKAPLPADEPARLAALHDAQVLDTAPEEDFDDIALLAAEICGTPMGLVSLVDENRQWFKAKVGLGLAEAPRDLSFCSYTINGREVLEVPDAAADERFADNPFVNAPTNALRFYAGAPVVLDGTYAVGTVCVVDHVPRELTEAQRRALRSLARHAAVQLELRRYARHSAEIADRLRQLDRMKDSFLATVSHELRTPLSTIRGYLEMLMEGEAEGETARRFLGVMQRNSDRLLRLIDELLQVARQADGMDLELAEVDLTELSHRVTSACQALAAHCEVELHDRTAGSAFTHADSKRLSQALNHLVVNALKFTPPGGVITVDSTGDGLPELVIADTGVGIAAEDLPHVFDRFYRCAAAEVMAVQGPGLGLAIVKSIVDAHHGSITLESELGTGTRARLTLPKG
jgi:signal transduction histidine kinase